MSLSIFTLWFGIIAYALQIYYDFSGYSDMAIGIGKMLGFNFEENFNFPYIATSIRDFWRRWHISLGTWFKDYVLYPFSKSSRIQKLQLFLENKISKKFSKNIVIILGTTLVFFLTGLWHGANYNFVLWGLYYAFFLILEDIYLKKILKKQHVLNHVYVILVVLIGYVIFSIEDISKLFLYLKCMFGFLDLDVINSEFIFYLKNYSILICIGIIFCFPISKLIPEKITNLKFIQIFKFLAYILLFILCIGYIISDSYNPFLYFRF